MSRDDIKGILIIITLVLLGALGFLLAYKLTPNSYDIDATTMCLKNKPSPLERVVLIDKSDQWSSSNVERIEAWLSHIGENIPMNSHLNIFLSSFLVFVQTSLDYRRSYLSAGLELLVLYQ